MASSVLIGLKIRSRKKNQRKVSEIVCRDKEGEKRSAERDLPQHLGFLTLTLHDPKVLSVQS